METITLTAYSVEITLGYATRTEHGHAVTVHAATEAEAIEAAEETAEAMPGVEYVTVVAARRFA
jgi:hypothetical protein